MAEGEQSPNQLVTSLLERRDAGDAPGALAAADAFLEEYGRSLEPELQTLIADALAVKAEALEGSERQAETIEVTEQLFGRFRDADDPRLLYAAAWGLRAQVVYLVQVDQVNEAVVTAGRLGAFFAGLPSTARRPPIGDQLVEVGYMLVSLGKDSAAVPLLELVVDEWGSDPGLPGYGLAVAARMLRVLAFTHLGDQERLMHELEALHSLDEAALRAIDALALRLEKVPKRWIDLAQVLSNRIAILSESGRTEEAERAISDFIRRFDRPDAPQPVQFLVHEFRNRP